VTQQKDREAIHDTTQADSAPTSSAACSHPEEFKCGVADGSEERFHDRAEQALKHTD